jgi:hypothetical protein
MKPLGSAEKRSASLNPVHIGGMAYFAATEVATVLEVSRQTLWRWRRAGKIPVGHRFRDGQTLFTEREVEEIKVFANRIAPIETTDRNQLELFKPPRT